MIEHTIDSFGVEIVTIMNEDGSIWSGLKSAWEELEAQREQSGTL